MLNNVATLFDIHVTVGVESCVVVELTSSYITCIAPKYEPKSGMPNAGRPEVNVRKESFTKALLQKIYVVKTFQVSN
jgi:hypothetical protein